MEITDAAGCSPNVQLALLECFQDAELLQLAAAMPSFEAVLAAQGSLNAVMLAAETAAPGTSVRQIALLILAVVDALLLAATDVPAAAVPGADAGLAGTVADAAADLRQAVGDSTTAGRQRMLRTADSWLPPARRLAAALLAWWRRPESLQTAASELGQVAATRSCAYLRCANLGGEGGPAAGKGTGSMRCR